MGDDGKATYTAWYEWYWKYFKNTLGDSTPSSFALASVSDGNLDAGQRLD